MTTNHNNIAVLILAAGASSRMGQPKQLLPWGETTLLNHAIIQAKEVSKEIFVVLGANKESIEKTLSNKVSVIFNPGWEKGMGTSIAVGISEIEHNYDFNAVLIMLADQPLLDGNYLSELKQSFFSNEIKIAATKYRNNHGVPAIFDNSLFQELGKLNQDYGAKKLIKKYSQELTGLNSYGKEIDIDTFETYQQLVSKLE